MSIDRKRGYADTGCAKTITLIMKVMNRKGEYQGKICCLVILSPCMRYLDLDLHSNSVGKIWQVLTFFSQQMVKKKRHEKSVGKIGTYLM